MAGSKTRCTPSQIGKCRFRLINSNVLTNRLELRDQWHADKSDENANRIYSFCNSMFHLLMRLFAISDIALEVAANSELNRPVGILELRSDRKPRNPEELGSFKIELAAFF